MPDIPGWLSKRVRERGGGAVHVLLAPATPTSAAIYLVEHADGFEWHAVDDASSGVDGFTLPMTRREASGVLMRLSATMSGRHAGIDVRPLPPLPVSVSPGASVDSETK